MANRKGIIETLDAILSVAARITGIAIAVGVGFMGFFLSDAANWVEQYQPFSSYVAGILGAFATAVILLIGTLARRWWVHTTLDAKFSERSTVNPTKRMFENERIFLTDLANPVTGRVHKKTFSGCEILGPANIFFIGSGQMIDNKFFSSDFIAIKDGRPIQNVIFVDECSFRECEFYRISILGTTAFFDNITAGLTGVEIISAEYKSGAK